MAKYDLAVSFAGEQRDLARRLAERLDGSGYSIFFDEFQQAELWGRDLTTALGDVYDRDARYCLVLVSADYLRKSWTNLERQNALSRFLRDRAGYLLCLRLDDSQLPGLPSVIGYIDLRQTTEDAVHALLLEKLGRPSHDDYISQLESADRDIARDVIEACYRRAIFTRMDSEIELSAMYDSIGEALGLIQRLIPRIGSQRLQFGVLSIIRSLDEIERVRGVSTAGVSNHLEADLRVSIDREKLQVIRLLLEIRRAAALPIQLPLSLRTDHFFGREAAREAPDVVLEQCRGNGPLGGRATAMGAPPNARGSF